MKFSPKNFHQDPKNFFCIFSRAWKPAPFLYHPCMRGFVLLLSLAIATAFAAESGERTFLQNTRQLILEGKRSGEGYFSEDGRALIFQSEREAENPFYQIYILNLETGDTDRASPGQGKTTCAFFRPASDEILFASTHHDPHSAQKQKAELDFRATGKQRRYSWDYDETMDIFSARRDGSNLKRLTDSAGYDAEASYSPDGKLIAFTSLRGAYIEQLSATNRARLTNDPAYFGEIYLMNADGSNQRRLTTTPGYDGGPFFSPDGKRIIWRHFEENGTIADIYSMNLEGADVRRLTDFAAMSWAPYFHPTGQYVIFAANKLGFANFELFLVDAEGQREPIRVTHTDGFDGLPVFSPDGKKLAWTSNRTPQNASQIFLADWNHPAALEALSRAPKRGAQTNTIESDVAYLASPELEGRRPGSPGAKAAADYLAKRLESLGFIPYETNSFLQPFEFTSGVSVGTNENRFELNTTALELGKDFHPLPFTENGAIEGDVVFAGYGLTAPALEGQPYDSYAGVNVSNKIVLVLRYVPEGVDQKRRQELNRYAGLRYKATMARNRGAKALLVVTGPNSPNAGELAKFASDGASAGSGIVAMTISGKTADALFAATGKALKDFQTALDSENPHADGSLALTNTRIRLNAAVRHEKKTDYNVVGWLPSVSSSTGNQTVMIGAHYDHLGHGETGGLAHKDEEGKIHPGADDNASGCAAVLQMAETLAAQWRKASFPRSVIVAFWGAEEIGLIGSSHFAEKMLQPTNTIAYLNFDMVGRLRENKLTINGTGSSSAWRKALEKRNVLAGFNLQLLDDPYAPTDVTAFYPKGIPVLALFTGAHEEYHRPADTPDTLNYEGIDSIAKFAGNIAHDLIVTKERPDYLKVERSDKNSGSRETLRVYLGTIPDYATEVKGVKLTGARAGSPAEKAGIKPGDIIIELAGQKIQNIYDYTYALDALKIGQPAKLLIQRGSEQIEITITPEARK